jgi:maltooligosyltrehalose trehalohydrolase
VAVTLFAACTPLLFMGEESLEPHPFQFFADHIDLAIAEATREGRKREFEAFAAFSGGDVPDPQSVATFVRSKLSHGEVDPLFRELLALRRELPREVSVEADEDAGVLRLRRGGVELVADFGAKQVHIRR